MNENILHKGATFFDPDYFFNLTDFTIPETESGCLQNVATTCYADGRIAYIYGNNPHYASNPADYVNDKMIQSFQIDLYNKMIKLLPLPHANTYSNFINKMGDFILFGLTTMSDGAVLFSYNHKTGEISKSPIPNASSTILDTAVFDK